MISTNTILAVGSIAIDSIKTPNGNKDNILGGSASFFSIASSVLSTTSIVGVIGEDYPESGLNLHSSRGINIKDIQVSKGKTFRWGGKYNSDYSKRDTLFTELGVFENFTPYINNDNRDADFVFLGNIQPSLQLEVSKMVNKPKYIISDTMNLWIDLFPEQLLNVINISDVFLINHEEAIQLSGSNNIEIAAKKFLDMGPMVVIIKLGSDGCYVAQKSIQKYIPVFPIKKLIDPTGAGDSFAGGLIGCLASENTDNFIEAAIFGSAMASFGVENFGLEGLLNITKKSLFQRINKIKSLI